MDKKNSNRYIIKIVFKVVTNGVYKNVSDLYYESNTLKNARYLCSKLIDETVLNCFIIDKVTGINVLYE